MFVHHSTYQKESKGPKSISVELERDTVKTKNEHCFCVALRANTGHINLFLTKEEFEQIVVQGNAMLMEYDRQELENLK